MGNSHFPGSNKILDHYKILQAWYRFIVFVCFVLKPYQQKLAEELLKIPEDAKITQSRQTGKSTIIGLLVYFLADYLRWNIILTAPTRRQTWGIMKAVHKVKGVVKSRRKFEGKQRMRYLIESRYELVFFHGGSITCLSGAQTAEVESENANLVVGDEHQDLDEEYISETFGAMLGGTILFQTKRTGGKVPFWTCGIGGVMGSMAERDECDFEWKLPWQQAHEELISAGREEDAESYERYIDKQKFRMMPEQFASHFECKRLDTAEKYLIPEIHAYDALPDRAEVMVGFDFGRSIDKTIGTVLHVADKRKLLYIEDWLIEQGSFDLQHLSMVRWLNSEKFTWDKINAEVNGIGHGPTDYLTAEFPEVNGITVNSTWKVRNCVKVSRAAANGNLTYNPNSAIAGIFVKDITGIKYKMTTTSDIKVEHSDFLSSLIIAMDEPKWGSVAA